ncbi:MAG TPA: FHA domain-containing protein [Longimicrobiales bacterium]
MLLPGIASYIIAAVLPIGAVVVGYAVWSRLRRRATEPPVMDDDSEEAFSDFPLVMRPQTTRAVVAPPVPKARVVPRVVESRQPQVSRNAVAAASESDIPMQLLPGRLEPLDTDVHQEIRFIKQPGVDRFTLGRSSGPAYSHIQLTAPTASRMHAYMRLEDGRWRIGNLSETNPVVVNGAPLESAEGELLLRNGDLIELGEIVFVFRDR